MTADMSVAVETVVVMVVPSITSHILHPTTDHEFKADCQWWRDNLVWLNGEVPLTEPCATCIACIDATGLGGIGVYVDGAFASLAPDSVRSQAAPGEVGYDHPCTETSTEWELFAFLVLLRWFGAALHGIVVRVHNDNGKAVRAVQHFNVSGLHSEYQARILREILTLCVRFSVRLQARWLAGTDNTLADALSRQRWQVVGKVLSSHVWSRCGRASPFAGQLCQQRM